MSFENLWGRYLVIGGCALILAGCSPKEHDAIVATVAGQPITLSQYENQYLRNAPARDSARALSQADRQRFLDLMVDYHLKLEDAQRNDLENKPAIRNEIRQYKGELTKSFVTDREIIQPALHRLYDRRLEEVRARHILLRLSPRPTVEDSVAAYKKANEIIASLKSGTPFDVLAKEYSIDPSAKQNGGDLYYFTGGMMVPPFEDAVYSMKPGDVRIVRTNFGLHVVQLVDRHPSPGEIHCAHIMIRFPSMRPTPEDTAKAYAKAVAILDSLKQGVDFAALAKRNSGDGGSAANGGDLGWFGRRRWVQEFDEAAFKLKPGEISGIVRSPYGYHIIKCLGQRPVKSFDEMKPELLQMYQQSRSQSDYDNAYARLKASVGLVRNDEPVKQFLATCDTLKTTKSEGWDSTLTATLGSAVIFKARGQEMTLDSVISTIKAHNDYPAVALRYSTFLTPLDKVEDTFVWRAAADSFAALYPDFASLLNEYKDGVLLYQMEQEHVWNKIVVNDSLLHAFYDKHRENYRWPDRLDITELKMATAALANKVYGLVKDGKSFEQIAYEDSVRMARPTRWSVQFTGKAKTLTAAMKKTLNVAGKEYALEPELVLQLEVQADTGKGPDATLPRERVQAVRKYFVTALHIDTNHVRIYTQQLPPRIAGAPSSVNEERESLLRQVSVSLAGRQPLIVARPESSLIPVNSDERAMRADTLHVGGFTPPFPDKGVFEMIRLNGRDPSHLKTFEEAQAEVSGQYQDFESERLKDAWLKGLRAKYPVVEHPEILKEAFASKEQ